MKVIQNTPTRLVVQERPWLVSLIVCLVILAMTSEGIALLYQGDFVVSFYILLFALVVALLILFLVARRVQVILDTVSNQMIIRRKPMTQFTSFTHDFNDLSHAYVETQGDSDGDTHRPVFVLVGGISAGEHHMTIYTQSGLGPEHIVTAVNDWLKDARQEGRLSAPVDSNQPTA